MVTEEPLEPEPRRGGTRTPRGLDPAEEPRISGAAVTRRMRISVAPGVAVDKASLRPDAWRLLVEARRASVPGLGLNHVMSIDSVTTNPFKMNPFKMNPFKMNPFKMNPSGMDGYAYPGMGGRQPVSFDSRRTQFRRCWPKPIARWSRSSTPAAVRTPGWMPSSSTP